MAGPSGTGKSSAPAELSRRSYRTVDTDDDGYAPEIGAEQLWREDPIETLLDERTGGVLETVILDRITTRTNNPFGKSDDERERILTDLATVEPLLRAGATVEIDARASLDEVVDALERIGRQITS
ncbi:MAG TPA: hypothetical protein VKR23_11460 [Gaiellaceae bacterium]|nr:hypothetical protein [Gaiellaceae bacterium]